jgi:ubiquinone/menaquinone biosynthesis C-methylase UbiE
MSIYEHYILPHLINCACGSSPIRYLRKQIAPRCYGKVLEVGMGSGLNLPYYNQEKVEFIWGLEPSHGMRKKASKNIKNSNIEVKWLDLPSEEIPLNSNSVDSILLTFCLCTIKDTQTALAEMHRVLKPNGKLFFAEHGISNEHNIAAWQNRITPSWKKVSGGCHLNRAIDKMITQANFEIESIERFYQRKMPKTAGFIYLGEARKINTQTIK